MKRTLIKLAYTIVFIVWVLNIRAQAHKIVIDGRTILLNQVNTTEALYSVDDIVDYDQVTYLVSEIRYNPWPECWIYTLVDFESTQSGNNSGPLNHSLDMQAIPDLSTWGLIILSLFLVNICLIFQKNSYPIKTI